MSDDDLIRRADAIAAVKPWEFDSPEGRKDREAAVRNLRALPAVEVGVKPLEWENSLKLRWIGTPPVKFGDLAYWIFQNPEGYVRYVSGKGKVVLPTLEAAKAAAQADYAARIRSALTVTPAPSLSVWYGSMPESNGKSNWTASLHRKGGDVHLDGFCFARSEYPDRVRYEADRMRWIIGELAEKPDILAYDADMHSGYIYPPAPDAGKVQTIEELEALVDQFRESALLIIMRDEGCIDMPCPKDSQMCECRAKLVRLMV